MMLPPDHKSPWKEFAALKAQDVKDGKGWMYEADPFQALREREESRAAAEKKRKQIEAAKEKAANEPGARGPALGAGSSGGSGGAHNIMRGWATVPKVEMGNKTRTQLEDLLRRRTVWNPHGVTMPDSEKHAVVKEFKELGFRQSHVEEAVGECKDREESLEWLLIHIPEDDLPRWALPEKYSAGVTVAATDLRREGAIKRLSQSGYSAELCRRVFDANGADEGKAAEVLQNLLVSSGLDAPREADDSGESWRMPEECWSEEMETLEASFGSKFSKLSAEVCQIQLESVKNGSVGDVAAHVQFRMSPHYPAQVILSVIGDLPAYIKLSVIKRALAYAHESLSGEEAKIYFLASWVQENINDIVEKPGALREVAAVASAVSEEPAASRKSTRRMPRHPKPISWVPNNRSRQDWLARQDSPAYKKMLSQREATGLAGPENRRGDGGEEPGYYHFRRDGFREVYAVRTVRTR